jgi:flagellum-specific ATP synthase
MSSERLYQKLQTTLTTSPLRPKSTSIGKVTRLVGLTLEAINIQSPVGTKCIIEGGDGRQLDAEIVGFSEHKTYLMCSENLQGIGPGARIIPSNEITTVEVGYELLGRIIDGAGKPLDGLGPIKTSTHYPLISKPINPLTRHPIDTPLDVGIRAINALLSIGCGQRIGLFAGSGVGKSVLLGMMTRYTSADIIVVGLIGERGREVQEFIQTCLGPEGLKRSVVIASPADTSPLMRLHAAMWATTVAEYFRDQGAKVLLIMDSLTRFAQAQREIALAIGEPPATKGYPPSVFTKLPQLVERAGCGSQAGGSITAIYTVLTEGDDQQDPIADSARAILDGHIVLSRRLAESGHYPAIDIEASISRVMTQISHYEHLQMVQFFKKYYSLYQQNKDLIQLGAYTSGSNLEIDTAITLLPYMNHFLQQSIKDKFNYPDSIGDLKTVVGMKATT